MKDMRAITMDKHAIGVEFVECIACNVFSLIDQKDVMTRRRAALRDHASSKASPNNKHVEFHGVLRSAEVQSYGKKVDAWQRRIT